jgi:hypothetical protein
MSWSGAAPRAAEMQGDSATPGVSLQQTRNAGYRSKAPMSATARASPLPSLMRRKPR